MVGVVFIQAGPLLTRGQIFVRLVYQCGMGKTVADLPVLVLPMVVLVEYFEGAALSTTTLEARRVVVVLRIPCKSWNPDVSTSLFLLRCVSRLLSHESGLRLPMLGVVCMQLASWTIRGRDCKFVFGGRVGAPVSLSHRRHMTPLTPNRSTIDLQ